MIAVLGIHHQGIGGVFPFGDAPEHQSLGQVGGEVLEGVDGNVSPSDQHLCFQFFGEQPLITDLGQGHIKDFVSLGRHRFNADGEIRMGLFQLCLHPVGLHHRQLTASRSDPQMGEGHGAGDSAGKPTQSGARPYLGRFVFRLGRDFSTLLNIFSTK